MQLYGLIPSASSEESENKCIPLQKVDVDVQILDMIAEVTLSQTYNNFSDDTIEAVYKFPMPAGAAVNHFEVEFPDNRKIVGKIEETKKAQQTYKKNLEQGHGAYLLKEQLPDIFEMEVGNISPRQILTIHIRYVQELANDTQDDDQVRFYLPTTIAPRYESTNYYGGPNVNENVHYSPSGAEYTLSVNVNARMSGQVLKVESPSHPVTFEIDAASEGGKVVKSSLAQKTTYLDKDLVLLIKSKALDSPRAFVEFNKDTNTHTVMLTLVPRFELAPVRSELVFIVDRSGSMMGDKIVKTKEALSLFIRSLPDDCFFNIISFGSSYSKLFKTSMPYSRDTFSKAITLVDSLESNMGGTEIYQPLEAALESARSDIFTTIILLTDGQVSQADAILKLIRKYSWENKKDAKSTRVFALGIGDAVSHYLVDGIARVGRGYSQYAGENERLEKKIIGMLKNAIQPPVNYQKIKWAEEETATIASKKPTQILSSNASKGVSKKNTPSTYSLPSIRQTPYIIPVILPHSRLIVYAILAQAPRESIHLSGVTSQGPIELDIPLEPAIEGTKLHTLAARKMIMELQESTSYVHLNKQGTPTQIPNKDELANSEILNLGLKFSLASKCTSFIAIDHRKGAKNTISHRVVVPTLNPEAHDKTLRAFRSRATSGYRELDYTASSTRSSSAMFSPIISSSAMFSPARHASVKSSFFSALTKRRVTRQNFPKSNHPIERVNIATLEQSKVPGVPSNDFDFNSSDDTLAKPTQQIQHQQQEADLSNGLDFNSSDVTLAKPAQQIQHQQQQADLSKLVKLSEFGGFFKLSEDLAYFLQFNSAKNMAEKKPHDVPEFEKDDVWATVLVIAFLNAKMPELSDVWENIEGKAKVWVTKQGIVDVNTLIEKAKQIIMVN